MTTKNETEKRLVDKQYEILSTALKSYNKIKDRCKSIQKAYEQNNIEEILTSGDYISNFYDDFMLEFPNQLAYLESIIVGKEMFCSAYDIIDWLLEKTETISFVSDSQIYKKKFDRRMVNVDKD